MLYFSYAANLNRSHMARLCPGAELLYPAVLEGYLLTVRRWFNVEVNEGGAVYGGVWRVGDGCIPRLDSYEDYPHLYTKQVLKIRVPSGEWNVEDGKWKAALKCMVYSMCEPFQMPFSSPEPEYLQMVREGYEEWGLPTVSLEHALSASV